MRDEQRDKLELLVQRLRERWIEWDETLIGPDSRFRETVLFIRSKPLYLRWITVLVTTTISMIIGALLQRHMTTTSQLMLYLPAVLISAMYGGGLAGTAGSFLGAALSVFWFANDWHSKEETFRGFLGLILYFMAAAIIISLARTQETYRQRLQGSTSDLEDRVEERTKELREANQELAGFCYSISHDLRAPMRNIVGSSRILLEDIGEIVDEEARLRLRGMADSANRLSSLVDDLLDYARLSNADLRVERIDISNLVEELCDRARGQIWRFSRLSTKIQPGLIAGGDAALIALAVRNIIENSCKYCKPDQTLSIEFGETRLRGHLYYFIRDNGIGFDMSYARKIFEPFQRLHRDADVPGTGIGLANVSRIIQRHDGDVFAESTPGTGSTFYFRLGSKLPLGDQITDPLSHKVVMADEA